MDAENARRNLKDFLSMYNQFTETCFERCVQNLNYRILTPEEESCTNKCVSKLINVNHREISVYMEINPLNRRLNELGSATDPQELTAPPPDIAKAVENALGNDAVVASNIAGVSDGSNSSSDVSSISSDSSSNGTALATEVTSAAAAVNTTSEKNET